MRVSIIIPVYNAENFLHECIDSALNQTYDDIEIIAVNDGSTDNSKKILEEYSSKIKIINKTNGGTPSALNAGISKMTGDWFKWLSADDILKNNCIEIIINEIKKLDVFVENFIFYSHYEYIDDCGHIIGKFTEPNYNHLTVFEKNVILLDHFYGNGITTLIHKSIFEKCGIFDEQIGYQEDYEFWLRCCLLNNYQLLLIPQYLSLYRIHENQLTQKKLDKNQSHAKNIQNLILNKLNLEKKDKYLSALKILDSKKPLRFKIRRKLRNMSYNIFPKKILYKITKFYLKKKF